MVATQVAVLPQEITVAINGTPVHLPSKLSAKGNTWYEARQEGILADPNKGREALAAMTSEYQGETLKVSESGVHVSEVKFRKDGSVRGGGNLTVTHARSITLAEQPYLLRVTATVVERSRQGQKVHVVVVNTTAIPQVGRTFQPVGVADGDLTF